MVGFEHFGMEAYFDTFVTDDKSITLNLVAK